MRALFKITVYDADLKEHSISGIFLDIPDHGIVGWEGVEEDEKLAKAIIVADLECDVEYESREPNSNEMAVTLCDVSAENEKLTAELASLRKDKDMLDWLEKQRWWRGLSTFELRKDVYEAMKGENRNERR